MKFKLISLSLLIWSGTTWGFMKCEDIFKKEESRIILEGQTGSLIQTSKGEIEFSKKNLLNIMKNHSIRILNLRSNKIKIKKHIISKSTNNFFNFFETMVDFNSQLVPAQITIENNNLPIWIQVKKVSQSITIQFLIESETNSDKFASTDHPQYGYNDSTRANGYRFEQILNNFNSYLTNQNLSPLINYSLNNFEILQAATEALSNSNFIGSLLGQNKEIQDKSYLVISMLNDSGENSRYLFEAFLKENNLILLTDSNVHP